MGNLEIITNGGDVQDNSLPRATATHLLELVLPEILDPTHNERWERFAKEQPDLAREVRNRATNGIPNLEYRKFVMDEVTFAYYALSHAQRPEPSIDQFLEQDTPLFELGTTETSAA
jgi:hypothetical protein